jgi:hypothetical protein
MIAPVRRAAALAALAFALCLPAGTAHPLEGPSTGAAPPSVSEAGGFAYRCRLVATKLGDEITLTLRLRTERPNRTWRVRLFHDGELVSSSRRRANERGYLKVSRTVPNLPGRDEVGGRARHLATGTVCAVRSRI